MLARPVYLRAVACMMVVCRAYCFSILLIFLPNSRSQDLVYSLPTQQSTVERGQLSSSNGDVFVGAGGTLYRLSSELQQLQNVSVPDSVLGLTTTADGDYLVACFTDRTCAVYNTTTLNTVDSAIESQNFLPYGVTAIALFTSSSLRTVYVGFRDGNRFELRQRGFAGNTFLKTYQSFTILNQQTLTRQIYGGFVYGSNAYFLALDTNGGKTMYIIRVCNDGQLAARYELQLTCGGTALSSSSVITGVSEVDGTLVVSVDGRVCSYNLTTIDTTLDDFFTSCLVNKMGANDPQFGSSGACSLVSGGNNNQQKCVFIPGPSFRNVVLNPQTMSSGSVLISEGVNTSLAISVEGNLFLFVATANSVEKHLFTAGSSGTTLLYSMAVSSPVTALSWSPAADYVYATVGNQVVRFPLETCSSSTTCSSCVANSDSLCGWCSVESKCGSATCSTNFVTTSSNCPPPMITGISPDSGPTEGGTTVTITGTDLGTSFGDIVSITVGSLTCTPIVTSYLVGRSITCNISSGSQTQLGVANVVVTVSRMGGANQDATSTQFRFGQPRVYSVSPSYGPGAGGTIVRVRGEDLNIGNTERTTVSLVTTGSGRRRRRQAMGTASCDIMSFSANEIVCSWSNFTADMSGVVLVTVNSAMVQNNSATYQYLNNPVYTGLTPQQIIRAGGIKFTFTGQYLNVSQQPRLQFNNGQTIVPACQQSSSGTTLVCIAPPLSVLNSYTVVMDAAPGPDTSDNGLRLELLENPVATLIRENSRRVDLSVNGSTISIDGQRITNVVKEEITVMVGRDQCVVQTTADTVITCIAPQRDEPVMESVTVSFGQNINNSVGQLEYFFTVDIAPIAGGAAGGAVLLICVILVLIILKLVHHLCSHQSLVPPSYNTADHDDDKIEMNYNIVYQRSTGVSGSLDPEVKHSYEELSGEFEEVAMAVRKKEKEQQDHDYVNDSFHSKQPMDETKKGTADDDDDYFVNIELFTMKGTR